MNHCSCESQNALNLIKTARGQLDGIVRMIDEDAYCIDVSKQLLAVAALVKKANLTILNQHMNTCVREAFDTDEATSGQKIAEITSMLESYMG